MRRTDAGPMRFTIKIQVRSTAQDENGEESPVWTTLGERYAEKVQMPGREFWSSAQRSARVPTIFKLRAINEFVVKPQMRVIHAGRVYDITSATDDSGVNKDLMLTCEELVNEPTS